MSIFANKWYYHITTKSFITAFGSIFDQLIIQKHDGQGDRTQAYVVPIDFAPKNKWILMINERPDYTTNQVQITLPRMAFEIIDIKPNMSRKLGFNGTYAIGNLPDGTRTKLFNPIPIDLTISLYAVTKDNDDMFQIIEQIVPYFQPHLTINFNLLPEFNIYKDVPISLMAVHTQDTYNTTADEQRLVETTFTFTAPLYYYPPVTNIGKIIKDVKVGFSTDQGVIENYEAKVNPITANQNQPHTIVETLKHSGTK